MNDQQIDRQDHQRNYRRDYRQLRPCSFVSSLATLWRGVWEENGAKTTDLLVDARQHLTRHCRSMLDDVDAVVCHDTVYHAHYRAGRASDHLRFKRQ